MTPQDEHNRKIQRRIEKRLQEIENMMNIEDVPFYETRKHQPENTQKSWIKKAIFGAKFFGLVVLTIVAIRIASVIAGFVMFGALAFLIYKLFLESKFKNIK